MINLKLNKLKKKAYPCLTQIYFLEYLLWQLLWSWSPSQWVLWCFFRLSLGRCDRQTNFRLLCLRHCQIQADFLWQLVRKNSSQGFSTWVALFCSCHTGAFIYLFTYLQPSSVNCDVCGILLTLSTEDQWVLLHSTLPLHPIDSPDILSWVRLCLQGIFVGRKLPFFFFWLRA